jgi:succinate-semialdehyde dehydrogenase/glutarate-semialdehyde dehydrogenase
MSMASVNPATGQTVRTFDEATDEQVDAAIGRAHDAYRALRGTSFAQRAGWMNAAADLLDGGVDDIARMMTTEMGKTLAAAKAEVTKCAAACRFYAGHAEGFLADEPADADAVNATRAFTRYQPINVPQTALFLEELFTRAGYPAGSFQALLIDSKKVERVLTDPRVRAATLTGSERAGRSVAEIAGRELKKTVLELGGSDPFVVMPSADLDRAAQVATTARCQNNGQSCIAAKRFIVHTDAYDAFAERFVAHMSALRVGDPMADGTDVGPLATEQGRRDVEEQVRDAVDKGARALCGGQRPDGPGWFYPPTVVADLTPDMRMWAEEVFGPVAGLYRVSSYEEAIELANGTPFGLGSNAWTRDPDERERFSTDLDAGSVFVNGMTTSYPQLPFGGVKNSGYGRELSAWGIREFCNVKTVWWGEGAAPGGTAHAE